MVASAIVGSAVVGGVAASSAAKKQSKAANKAANLQQQQYELTREDQLRQYELTRQDQRRQYEQARQDQMPFLRAGYGATGRLNELLGLGANTGSSLYGKYARDFSMQDFETDPGYGFVRDEGFKALMRQDAARGGLISGGSLKAAQRYGQQLASQEFDNAFNRYQINRANQLNPLQSMMGAGQTSVNALGNTSQAYGAGAGNVAQNYATGGGNIAVGSGLNQAGLRLNRGNISAGQYGNYGRLLGAIGGMYENE